MKDSDLQVTKQEAGVDSKYGERQYSTRRHLRLLVWDADLRVPDDKSVLVSKEILGTSLTDDELKADMDLTKVLADHNKIRTDAGLNPLRLGHLSTRLWAVAQ